MSLPLSKTASLHVKKNGQWTIHAFINIGFKLQYHTIYVLSLNVNTKNVACQSKNAKQT